MDPISTAIVAAVSAGAVGGITTVGKEAVTDAYKGLKELIRSRFGNDSDLAEAVDKLEARPDSKSRQGAIQEEVEIAKADEDAELVEAAKKLMERLGPKQAAKGKFNIRAENIQGVVQADNIDTLNQNFGSK